MSAFIADNLLAGYHVLEYLSAQYRLLKTFGFASLHGDDQYLGQKRT